MALCLIQATTWCASSAVGVAAMGGRAGFPSAVRSHWRAITLDDAAPERLQGSLSDRSDQYALAVSYCQLRSGQLPYPEPPPGFGKDYTRPAPDLSMLTPAEGRILARALSAVPQDR